MINFIIKWWRSYQFKSALKQGNKRLAAQIIQKIQKSGSKLSWAERLYKDKLQLEQALQAKKQEVTTLSSQLSQAINRIELVESQLELDVTEKRNLELNQEFINFIYKNFNLVAHDEYKLQATGIDKRIFDDFEAKLVAYLKNEFKQIPAEKLRLKLQDALEDINGLKIGQDPGYHLSLTPHVYYMKYFLENVYCVYLAWFLIYEAELLPAKVNILDIAAGPGTVAFGLALMLHSASGFISPLSTHISYYSLEKQDTFQYRGLQFWRKYIESSNTVANTFFRFVTADLFNFKSENTSIPKNFFDFIVISHCFFPETMKRMQANYTCKQIIDSSLRKDGYVLIIVQDKKLFKTYGVRQTEDKNKEQELVNKVLNELELELVWYRYLTSTHSRTPFSGVEFSKFAQANLPKQIYINSMLQQYFNNKILLHYTLDDYVILARKN